MCWLADWIYLRNCRAMAVASGPIRTKSNMLIVHAWHSCRLTFWRPCAGPSSSWVLSDRRPNSQLSDIDEHLALYGSEAYGRVPPRQLGMIFPW